MNKLLTLNIEMDMGDEEVDFGLPSTQHELDMMFNLRKSTYGNLKYFNSEKFEDDIDEYDNSNKIVYFIASYRGIVIGTLRIIIDTYLPTETEAYKFKEPRQLKYISRTQRAEISRMIVSKDIIDAGFPRHIIMLFLIKALTIYFHKHSIYGGYAFVKKSLLNKLRKLRFPIKDIKRYQLIYPKDKLLAPYFYKDTDMVVPTYYRLTDVDKYYTYVMSRLNIDFNKQTKTYKVNNDTYNKLLIKSQNK